MSRRRRSQPAALGAAAGPGFPGFPADEWALLTHLPAQVVIAAISVGSDGSGRTVVAGLAGIEAIAGGRAFDSDLVRAVVATIFAEPDAESAPPGAQPVARGFAGRTPGVADVLAACRSATAVLAKADPADSAAYRQWLQSIAARACEAARSGGGPAAAGGERYRAAGRRLLGDLGAALFPRP
jgi:hypothetical protein